MSTKQGPPKHQNRTAWKANAGIKKNDRELGGKLNPYPQITGVCPRCKAQIEWRRKYGKYKAITEPAKCNQCSKRAVRQAYYSLCPACAKERNVCAKCCQPSETIFGRDAEKEREERQILENALKNLRERDKRTLLREMTKGVPKDDKNQVQSVKEGKSKGKQDSNESDLENSLRYSEESDDPEDSDEESNFEDEEDEEDDTLEEPKLDKLELK